MPEHPTAPNGRRLFHRDVTEIVDMSERTLDRLLQLLGRNKGVLGPPAQRHEFACLEAHEVAKIERIYADCFHRTIDA